jgi:hypothetical protein
MIGRGGAQPRMGGGFNAGMGGMGGFGEHLDENAMQQALGQKQLAQQSTSQQSAIQAGQGGGKAHTDFSQQQAEALHQAQPNGAAVPASNTSREVGTLTEELLTRPVQDIAEGLMSFFDINALLGVNPQVDSPEEQAKKKQLHQRWQQLNQEQQQVAQQKYQQEMQKKQAEEEEKQRIKQQEAAAASQTIQAPSSPQKGPQGPGGSKKQKAVTKLQNDRKQLGGPSSVN